MGKVVSLDDLRQKRAKRDEGKRLIAKIQEDIPSATPEMKEKLLQSIEVVKRYYF